MKEDKTPWSCIGAVLAAIILGLVTLIVSSPTLIPFLQGPTATPLPTSLPEPPKFIIQNFLVLPAKIYIDDEYQGQIASSITKTFLLRSVPAKVRFEMIPALDSNNQPWGESIEGVFFQVDNGSTLSITNVVGDNFYFYPLLSNYTNQNCEISINDGLYSERRIGTLTAGQQNVAAGYYKLFSNSNVTLYCGEVTYHWGERSGQITTDLQDMVIPNSGVLQLQISQ